MSAVVEKTFDVVLRDTKSSQRKYLSVAAGDKSGAVDEALRLEAKAVEFSLEIPDRDYWESPPGHEEDQAVIDLSRWDAYDPEWARHASQVSYGEAKILNEKRLNDFMSRATFLKSGKIGGRKLGPRTRARLATHLQDAPFEIEVVQVVDQATIDRERLVRRFAELVKDVEPRSNPANWDDIIKQLQDEGEHTAAVTALIHGIGVSTHDSGASPIVWGTGTGGDVISVTLHTALTADPDTQQFYNASGVSSTESTGTNWASGGVALAGKTWAYDTTTDQTRGDASDISVSTVTVSATDAVIRKNTGTPSTSQVYGSIDFGGTVAATAGTWQMTWDATGIVIRDYT